MLLSHIDSGQLKVSPDTESRLAALYKRADQVASLAASYVSKSQPTYFQSKNLSQNKASDMNNEYYYIILNYFSQFYSKQAFEFI